MLEANSVRNDHIPGCPRKPRNEKTAFGRTLEDFRRKFAFHNRDLLSVDGFIKQSDIEQLSRMSTDVEAIRGMGGERLQSIIDRTASATVKKLEEKWEYMEAPPNFRERMKERLLNAANSDLEMVEQQHLKDLVIQGMVRLTGRSLVQLAHDLDERKTGLRELLELWGINDASKTTSKPGTGTS